MRGLLLFIIFSCLLPLIIFKGPFVGILMWFWLSLMNPHMIVYGIFAGLNYALIVAGLTLFCWLLSPSEPKLPPLNKTTALLVLMMIWISITSLFGIGPRDDIDQIWQLTEKMLFMTLVAYAMTNTRKRFDQLILVCVLSLGFFGLRGGLIAIVTGGTARVSGPEGTMIGDNNDLAVALNMIVPLLFYLRQRYDQHYFRWPFLGLIGLTLLGCAFTYSRGGLIALCVMGSFFWFRARQKFLLTILIGLVAGVVITFAPPEWTNRMSTIQTYEQDESAESRLYMWNAAWALAMAHPIVGGGIHWSYSPARANEQLQGSDLPPLTRPRAPHSIWFQMLGDHGFVGLALFVAIFVSVFVDSRWLVRVSHRRPDLLWANNLGRMLQVSLVGFAVGGSFVSLALYDGFYALVIIAAAARRIAAAEISTNLVTSRLKAVPGPALVRSVRHPELC